MRIQLSGEKHDQYGVAGFFNVMFVGIGQPAA
jgi:hypothetical protein